MTPPRIKVLLADDHAIGWRLDGMGEDKGKALASASSGVLHLAA